jgi:hypothetical protein
MAMFQHLGLSVPLGGTQEPFKRSGTGTRLESSSTRGGALFKLSACDSKELRRFFGSRVIPFTHDQEPMSDMGILRQPTTPVRFIIARVLKPVGYC